MLGENYKLKTTIFRDKMIKEIPIKALLSMYDKNQLWEKQVRNFVIINEQDLRNKAKNEK